MTLFSTDGRPVSLRNETASIDHKERRASFNLKDSVGSGLFSRLTFKSKEIKYGSLRGEHLNTDRSNELLFTC